MRIRAPIAVLYKHNISADALTIEVPKSRLIVDIPGIARELSKLRDMGTRVSMDDFGADQASLTRLFGLPATEQKFDQSFISKGTRKRWAFIAAMVRLLKELNLRMIAEGVSRKQGIQLVRSLSCHRAQGYGIATPMAGHGLAHWRTTRDSEADGNGETA